MRAGYFGGSFVMLSLRSILLRQNCYFNYDGMLCGFSMTFLWKYYWLVMVVYWLLFVLS